MTDHRVVLDAGDQGLVLTVLPGVGYTAQGPVLAQPAAALRAAGWTVRTVVWDGGRPDFDDARRVYADVLRDGVAAAPAPAVHLVLAKSLGTLALPVAVELGLPGAWLTPLLTADRAPEVRAAVAGLGATGAPALLAGGTADALWDGGLAATSGARVLEVDGGDHSLEVDGDPERTARVLDDVTAAVVDLARELHAGRD
ncbi:alpha/beta hydrolase [Krasilnikoviella flava]|uniref:Alpha/beta hydrolase family protein n=1 Tax=Krasilnikoviella flava TaxID=526729 RepID=A0A1T5IFK5_9MICO|nr:alpha/beta hydrolase [Krasilnikoviella flava]SKC37880.1 hypothetical protein SAMN04324258_0456 [Krasilnikoviella flava]